MANGQGATEYLVLLAVVLIVALVSVALLGFFPGMASDAQLTQSKAYWTSAQPISIVESSAYFLTSGSTGTLPYIRMRNVGAYPIRITKVFGTGGYASKFWISSLNNISDYYYMAPGEEKFFGSLSMGGSRQFLYFYTAGSSDGMIVSGATSICGTSSPWGTLAVPGFGFEYVEYLDNSQQITKREVGTAPLLIKCSDSSASQ